MAKNDETIWLNDRRLSVIVFSLFSSWLLAFPFQGQILYAIVDNRHMTVEGLVFGTIAAHFAGLFLCGFFIKTMKTAKYLMLGSIIICILASTLFFFSPSDFWSIALAVSSFLAGACVAAWSFFFKNSTPKNERIKTAADGLIYSNIIMTLLNMAAIHLSAYIGLALSILMLGASFVFALRLPVNTKALSPDLLEHQEIPVSFVKPLAFLCLFIALITINSGLMYQVLNPAFTHLKSLASWYWAVPYIVSLFIMRNLPRKANRTYILYVAIAMMGFSFIAFMALDRSVGSYLLVNTLMLGACGVYDLFWWSILGEMIDFRKNPAKVFGIGLSANVLGVLLGGLIGNAITFTDSKSPNSTLLALSVVCITLAILPPLHKRLTVLLKNHVYLTLFYDMSTKERTQLVLDVSVSGRLTKRENELAQLLLTGKTYRMIAGELHVSENTVRTHVKNIYSKLGVQSRVELINLILKKQSFLPEQLKS